MIKTFERKISKDLKDHEQLYSIIDREKAALKAVVRKYLRDTNQNENLADSINTYIGGSYYCQCPGCAESINHIVDSFDDEGNFVVSLDFNTEDAQRYLEEEG